MTTKVKELTITITFPCPSGYAGPNGIVILADVPEDKMDTILDEFSEAVYLIIDEHDLPIEDLSA